MRNSSDPHLEASRTAVPEPTALPGAPSIYNNFICFTKRGKFFKLKVSFLSIINLVVWKV